MKQLIPELRPLAVMAKRSWLYSMLYLSVNQSFNPPFHIIRVPDQLLGCLHQ